MEILARLGQETSNLQLDSAVGIDGSQEFFRVKESENARAFVETSAILEDELARCFYAAGIEGQRHILIDLVFGDARRQV